MKQHFSINIIGSGNVATHLSRALKSAGHDIRGVYSMTPAHAARLAALVGAAACNAPDDLPEAQVFILSVSDDALPGVAARVAALPAAADALLLHTAGSLSIGVFPPGVQRAGVFYPMQTFTREVALDFTKVPLFIEVRRAADAPLLERLARSVSAQTVWLDGEGRKHLHLAAVFACNFSNRCIAIAEELLEARGVARGVLQPLIDETMRKLREVPAAEGQTGPARRHDEALMQGQAALLRAENREEQALIYELMSKNISERY